LHFFYNRMFPDGSDRSWVLQAETRFEMFISITGGAVIIAAMPFITLWTAVLLLQAAMI